MKHFEWNKEKNERLKIEREIGFEDIVIAMGEGGLIDVTTSQNRKKYPYQRVYIVEIDNYVYLVPFVEDEEKIFLKTIIPSRKATKKYLIDKK